MTCNDYRHLYREAHVWTPLSQAEYRDPVRSGPERKARAARLAKENAALRRAKLAERWVVYTVAGLLALAMLPVLIAIAVIAAAVTVWRRVSRSLNRRANVAEAEDSRAEVAREQVAAVRQVEVGIHVPPRRARFDVRHPRSAVGKSTNDWRGERAMEGV